MKYTEFMEINYLIGYGDDDHADRRTMVKFVCRSVLIF
jgi:hypothetical protein